MIKRPWLGYGISGVGLEACSVLFALGDWPSTSRVVGGAGLVLLGMMIHSVLVGPRD